MLALVRHAKAGSRKHFDGDDTLRPLTNNGRTQAAEMSAFLAEHSFERIVSSHYTRCIQTVEPLAEQSGIPIELHHALAEESARADQNALLDESIGQRVVLCSHGDVLGDMLQTLRDRGFDVDPDRCEKGSIWIIETVDGTPSTCTYRAPARHHAE